MATFGPIASALVAEGCTAEQIAAAVIALERAREREREERLARLREGARLRQQRRRERLRGNAPPSRLSRRDEALPLFPLKEISPTPPKENNPLNPWERAGAPTPHRLPAEFEPSAEDLAFGAAEGLSGSEIARTIEDLRLWAAEAIGAKALRADWHATLRRFMRRDADAKQARPSPPTSAPPAASPKTFHVKRDSPQGEAWWSFVKRKTGKTPPLDKAGGWRFPSERPPSEPKCAQQMAES
ncbi:hypothetical protein Msil_2167 [Methylocella silvestris BL2]|uniref:Uncharacterized protein n=1 Tax=Methylocella silvestris (strain DSM 15510 / CIP 108128 / LMG 27833 / NCIMB 13906 / BL2) TaxID=395965 RepID=B8ESW7_METSB|nr:hypothetical protein [Methylocella silvestris]ACK51105.1 hypothetical protein Msil_2167 [Methylocella silvestris BL2]